MDSPWASMGQPMAAMGRPLNCAWAIHGQSVGSPWAMESPWTVHRAARGQSVTGPWAVHGQPVAIP
eukprot:5301729-Lingulodinium_polyedra.AAC.1